MIVRDTLIIDDVICAEFNENSYEIVNGITFDKLKDVINIASFDIIVIDTEGYDIELIKLMLSNNLYPKIIYFETPEVKGYIPNYENNEKYIIKNSDLVEYIELLLNENNYFIKKLDYNWICIKK